MLSVGGSVNQKLLGWQYLYCSLLFLWTGALFSWLIRSESSGLSEQCLVGDNQFYNVLLSSHAALMIFMFIMPSLVSGMANLYLPQICGVPELIFPRLNNLGLLLLPVAYVVLVAAFLCDEGAGTGWTIYPPLAGLSTHAGLSADLFILGLNLVALSSLFGGWNVLCTALVAKRFFSSTLQSSVLGSVILVVSVLLALVLPVLAAGFFMVLSDRNANSTFFDVSSGGDVLLYQHLFWIFGHPEVYVIILPAFGAVIYVLSSDSGEIFNRLGAIYAIVSIALVGFFVWVHHMFVAGLDIDARTYFQAVTMLIALPTALKLFTWLVSIIRSVFGRTVLHVVHDDRLGDFHVHHGGWGPLYFSV
jgi:cytochrome c oxidase subunit 1